MWDGMQSDPVHPLLGEASDTSQAGEHARCLELSRRVTRELHERSNPDPILLGWAWFYELKSLFFLERWSDAWKLLPPAESIVLTAKNLAYASSLASEIAMHLGRPDDVVHWGQRCMQLRETDGDPVGEVQSAQTVCVLLKRLERSDLNAPFARRLIEVGERTGAERPIIAGARFLLEAAQQTATLRREVVDLLPRVRRIHDDRFSGEAIEVAQAIWSAEWFLDCQEPVERERAEAERALLEAANEGNVTEISKLLDDGAAVDARDAFDRTALLRAAFHGHRDAVELLLARGADANAENMQRRSAVIIAADQGHASVVHSLLEHGADPDHAGIHDQTALIVAGWQGHVECVRLLLEAGADPEPLDVAGNTALTLTATEDQPEVVRALLEGGADVDHATPAGHTALMKAAMYGRQRVVAILLGAGADPSRRDENRMTAAKWAAQEGFSRLAGLLRPLSATKSTN
jgi:ankyrin repeat protein